MTEDKSNKTVDSEIETYISERVDDQYNYFDSNAIRNKKAHNFLNALTISCNLLTTSAIAMRFALSQQLELKLTLGVLALIFSAIVLATYQVEQFQEFGTKWVKFRFIAEQIKSEKLMFLYEVGRYSRGATDEAKRRFINRIEDIIHGTHNAG